MSFHGTFIVLAITSYAIIPVESEIGSQIPFPGAVNFFDPNSSYCPGPYVNPLPKNYQDQDVDDFDGTYREAGRTRPPQRIASQQAKPFTINQDMYDDLGPGPSSTNSPSGPTNPPTKIGTGQKIKNLINKPSKPETVATMPPTNTAQRDDRISGYDSQARRRPPPSVTSSQQPHEAGTTKPFTISQDMLDRLAPSPSSTNLQIKHRPPPPPPSASRYTQQPLEDSTNLYARQSQSQVRGPSLMSLKSQAPRPDVNPFEH